MMFFQTISQKPMQQGPPIDIQMFYDESWKPVYFVVKDPGHNVCVGLQTLCCCVCKLCWVFPAVLHRCTSASETVFFSSLPHVSLPLDAGFSPSWFFALLWVTACSSSCWYAFRYADVCLCIRSGQVPAEADFNLLDTARKVEVYGIRMHQAKVCYLQEHKHFTRYCKKMGKLTKKSASL